MSTYIPKRFAYSVLLIGALVLAGFAGLGIVRAVHSETAGSVSAHVQVCPGVLDAQVALKEAASLDNLDPSLAEKVKMLAAALMDAEALEQDGNLEKAIELEKGVARRLEAVAGEDDANEAFVELVREALAALFPCLERSIPVPIPIPDPVPDPVVAYAYSAKFVCGRNQVREPMHTPNFGTQPFLFAQEQYQTEINIHNFTNQRVVFWTKAVVANPQGTHRGKVSDRVREVLGSVVKIT